MMNDVRYVFLFVILTAGLTVSGMGCFDLEDGHSVPRVKEHLTGENVKTLPDGTRVEILGINHYPSRLDAWWMPDGSLVPFSKQPGYKTVNEPQIIFKKLDDESVHHFQIYMKIHSSYEIKRTFSCDFTEGVESSTGMFGCERDGETFTANWTHMFQAEPSITSTDMKLVFAGENWKTVISRENLLTEYHDTNYNFVEIEGITEGEKCVSVSFHFDELPELTGSKHLRDPRFRVLATDKQGAQYKSRGKQSNKDGKIQMRADIRNITLDDLQKIEIQTRPYVYCEFPHIRLSPLP